MDKEEAVSANPRMTHARTWWYSIVSASPDPESGERVHVAILYGNGRANMLDFDERLFKLSCLVSDADRSMYLTLLQTLRRDIRDFESVSELNLVYSPQLSFSEPRPLFQQPDESVRSYLRRKELSRPRSPSRSRTTAIGGRIDKTIGAMVAKYSLSPRITRKVTPQSLFPEIATDIFPPRVPPVDRALSYRRRHHLIAGVRISRKDPGAAIRNEGLNVGRAFWHYSIRRDFIEATNEQKIRTVGRIYNGDGAESAEVREVRDYLEHLWAQDADRVVQMKDEATVAPLREDVRWLTD